MYEVYLLMQVSVNQNNIEALTYAVDVREHLQRGLPQMRFC